MAFRTFSGRRFSENGWPYVDEGSCKWFPVARGVSMQIQEGAPYTVLGAFARDYHEFVEPIFDPDCCCWTPGNSVPSSNHPGGTAFDLRWQSHPFQKRGSFTAAQLRTIQELMDWYEGTVFWAGVDWKKLDKSQGGWGSPIDEMHWQMGYGTYDQAAGRVQPWVSDFIARKIRTDGFSTFRRGRTTDTPPAAPSADAAAILAKATGITIAKATQILPAVGSGLLASGCNTVRRIAMWLAQVGHESDNFEATEEYDKGDGGVTERWKYLGRTWIQITWLSNYLGFSRWCFEHDLVSSPTYFGDHPRELADLKWAGLGPAWYWTVARPTINALCDAGDLIAVTKLINGGTNGLEDTNGRPGRRTRYNRALTLGDQLLTLTQSGDDEFMAALNAGEQREVLNLLRVLAKNPYPSRSPLRRLGEGDIDTIAGIGLNEDGNVHVIVSILLGLVGDPNTLADLAEVAEADLNRYPDRRADAALARRILVYIATVNPAVLQASTATKKGA